MNLLPTCNWLQSVTFRHFSAFEQIIVNHNFEEKGVRSMYECPYCIPLYCDGLWIHCIGEKSCPAVNLDPVNNSIDRLERFPTPFSLQSISHSDIHPRSLILSNKILVNVLKKKFHGVGIEIQL